MLADRYYESGRAGLGYLPFRPVSALRQAGQVYRRIGVRLRARGLSWGDGRVVTSAAEKPSATRLADAGEHRQEVCT